MADSHRPPNYISIFQDGMLVRSKGVSGEAVSGGIQGLASRMTRLQPTVSG